LEVITQIAEKKKLVFDGYEVKSVLGEGGLGVVYLAKQLSMKRFVALKVLYPKWVKDEEFRKRFLLEARIVGKLSHANLIQVFDIGFDKGQYYFSMEYISGKSLETLVEKNGPIEFRKALNIALEVLSSLEYIWKKKLVHRDIKPGNIMLTADSIAKLGDFGFVKCNVESQLCTSDYVLGTPDYMSPEQAMGREDMDFRSDIYSLGATLYYILTASPPFQGTESMVIRQHIKSSIPSPKSIVHEIPDSVCIIIEKMMAKLPKDRYNSATELEEDLRLCLRGKEPKQERLDPEKSAVARSDDENHAITKLYKLEREHHEFQQREKIYQGTIIFLLFCLGLVSLLLFAKG
jgi:serine/threonine-protein kinase